MNSPIKAHQAINNLQVLYKADFSDIHEGVLRSLEATEEIQQLRQTIQSTIPNSDWQVIRSEILTQLEQLLDIELYPILIDSWKTHQDVSRELNVQQESGVNEISIVNLDPHEIKSTHSPCLSITIGNNTHLMRSFIGITLKLKGVTLIITNGEIDEVVSGTVEGKGFMQYQNATLIEKDFLEFSIAGITATDETTGDLSTNESKFSNNPLLAKGNDHHIDNPLNQPTSTRQEQTSPPASSTSSSRATDAQNIQSSPALKPKSAFSKILQFIIGVSLALLAVYLFWILTDSTTIKPSFLLVF